MLIKQQVNSKGIWIGTGIILLWATTLLLLLNFYHVSLINPLTYLLMLLQTHLYTGLFITAHDAMHGSVSGNRRINNTIGRIAAGLFAYNIYSKLFAKHHQHHRHVATSRDPDYHTGSFFSWYLKFTREYVSIWQILLMAVTYEALLHIFPKPNVIIFYIIPSLLSTLQLFYFGTYIPHRGEHHNRYKSTTQKRNHIRAFLTCYFFGYHYEHHHMPGIPWWQLHKEKDKLTKY